jgi:methane monooxygenase component A gamma chain
MVSEKLNKVHDNATRDEWTAKIGALKSFDKAVHFLVDFRRQHTTPLRESYALELDHLWIEAKIEERVAVLKEQAFKSAQDLLHKCATGESAADVVADVKARMAACDDKWEAEKIHIKFRLAFKPPIMPTNYFMDADRVLGSRLMELRNLNYYDMPLEEMRKKRGVKVLVAKEHVH